MSRVRALNLGAAVLSLALSAWLALPKPAESHAIPRNAPMLVASAQVVREHGRDGLRDASGYFVPLGSYQRIASTSGVTDSVLLALAEPTRIAAFTRFSADNELLGYRYAGKPTLVDLANLESVVALKPDLVLVNSLGGGERIARLRDAGLLVFDLGEMRGVRTLLPNIASIGRLLGRPEAADRLARSFARRMQRLAAGITEAQRPSGLYVSIYGDGLYGGGAGTSYHDVLAAGGVRDVAALRYRDWMRYTPEMLLSLDPDVIVTHDGMTRALCKHPGLEQMRVCIHSVVAPELPTGSRGGHKARVVEISGSLLDDPSMTMLDAAEAVFEAVHGEATPLAVP